ncbi:MAG: single-stranded DNA-binding protein [Anaerolineae bacterium]|nr:single-stranded DNA-binding protein [Gloeobacterales cyanobacterium ES-bin-313]
MNVIALLGNLQSEPELRFTQDGLARMSMMLSFAAERPDEADYQIRVVAFGNLAEETHKNFHHGDSVAVEGRLQAETRTRPDGMKEKVTEVIARKIHSTGAGVTFPSQAAVSEKPLTAAPVASRPPAATSSRPAATSSRPPAAARPLVDSDMDDIPF